jgi:hypothetical protein
MARESNPRGHIPTARHDGEDYTRVNVTTKKMYIGQLPVDDVI